METPLDDELTSINSIYGPGTLSPVDHAARVCTLSLPGTSVVLRLEFPPDYPDAPPSFRPPPPPIPPPPPPPPPRGPGPGRPRPPPPPAAGAQSPGSPPAPP